MSDVQKVVIEKTGSYDRLLIKHFPLVSPKDNECLIKVKACGVNFADTIIRQGLYESAKKYVGYPITPGFEVSGVIERVGKLCKQFKEGDEVLAVTRFGGYTSAICVPEHQVFYKPELLSFEEAAAFPAVYLTAYHALFQNIVLRENMDVLVHSAAGGMGTALLQLLNIVNCNTLGVVGSDHKVTVAKEFGAHTVINKRAENLWQKVEALFPQKFDVILDANGPSTLKESYEHLKPMGKLLIYGFHSMFSTKSKSTNWLKLVWTYFQVPKFNPLNMTGANKSIVCFNVSYLFDRTDLIEEAMVQLLIWVKDRKIKPSKIQVFPFDNVREAHRAIESGKTTGKLVLRH